MFKALSITVKINVIVVLAVFAVCFGLLGIANALMDRAIMTDLAQRADTVDAALLDVITADSFASINSAEDTVLPLYTENQQYLSYVRALVNAQYLYTAKQDGAGRFVYIVDGLDTGDPRFKLPGELVARDTAADLEACVAGGGVYIYRHAVHDVKWGYVDVMYCPVHNADGTVAGVIGLAYSVNDVVRTFRQVSFYSIVASVVLACMACLLAHAFLRKVTEPYYKKLAYNDFVSGLPNRLAYEHRFRDYEVSGASLENVTLVIFDLNNLKEINDAYGHRIGDIAIKQTARILNDAFLQLGGAYRIGGDEFAVFAECENPADVRQLIDSLYAEDRLIHKDKGLHFNAACGAATFDPNVDKNLHDVFDRADYLMYENKRLTKGIAGMDGK
jgi:diguanylate cyclase (GGDEF)-like protein